MIVKSGKEFVKSLGLKPTSKFIFQKTKNGFKLNDKYTFTKYPMNPRTPRYIVYVIETKTNIIGYVEFKTDIKTYGDLWK